MEDKLKVIEYNLSMIINRVIQLEYSESNYEIEKQFKFINEKIYEISDAIGTIEILLEDIQLDTKNFN